MKRFSNLQCMAASVACLGMMLPTTVLGAAPAPGRIVDISLRDGGVLVGQVVDAEGHPQVATPVSIQRGGEELQRVVTNADGIFTAKQLRGGVYNLVTSRGVSTCRLWSAGTAPPAAQQGALLVSGDDVVRGQLGGFGGIGGFLSNPWVLAAIVATAIAVPIAVADNDNGS